jgi:nitroreductase
MDAVTNTAALLRARYGAAAPAAGPANAVIEALLAHRSVRAFLPQALAEGTIEMLAAAAQSASTSSNMQAWSVVAVQEPARRSRLATLAANQDFIREAPLFLAWIADTSRLQRAGEAAGKVLEGTAYLESFLVATVDAALASQNAVVAAESLGLGCVYVGALRNHPLEVAEELALPAHAVALFGLAVGYPDPARPAEVKPRLPQSVVLHREQYRTEGERAAVAEYDAELSRFSERNAMGPTDWSKRMVARLGTVASLRGRDAMREWLRARGFPLR